MKCRKVYFISGLGADHRVFKYIQVPAGMEVVHLNWITPNRQESLCDYARRLSHNIDTSEPFALVGLSFGGMLATEIAKYSQPVHTVLISSVPLSAQLPGYFRLAALLRLHKIVPISVIKLMAKTKRLVAGEQGEDKKLLLQLIQETDPRFLRWAMDAILTWSNDALPVPFSHIHGNRDEVLPSRFTKPTHIIQKAGHLAVITKPAAINALLQEVLSTG